MTATSLLYATADTAFGCLLAARDPGGICAVYLGDRPAALAGLLAVDFPAATPLFDAAALAPALAAIHGQLQQPQQTPQLTLSLGGTAFQRLVWQALRGIRPGETVSYSELAARIGRPQAVRAVASACAANRLAIVVPCHRVIGKNGQPGGYRWGAARKRQLLQAEGALPG